MSASDSGWESSSLAHQDDSDAMSDAPERSWVVLVSTPRIVAAAAGGDGALAYGTNVDLSLHDPPKPSYLVLPPRMVAPAPGSVVARQQSAYILAADPSGRLLFRVSSGNPAAAADDALYLCNTHARRARRLPAVPYSRLRIEPRPLRSIGLIADPRHHDHYLVAQLYPRDSAIVRDRLLCYSTATSEWSLKQLIYSVPGHIRHNPCYETGVVAHDGRLYWLSLAYGVFVSDPFAATSHLRFLPLPAECQMWVVPSLVHRGYIAQRRRLVRSQGLLRYVEIWGQSYEVYVPPDVAPPPVNPSVGMWTLVDPEAEEPWRFEYAVPFAEVWEDESYAAFGLPHGEVPHIALVDPYNHRVVYFLQGSKLYGLDVGARRVVSCEDCSVRDDREIMFRNSRPIIDAWELSPPSPPLSEQSLPSPRAPPTELSLGSPPRTESSSQSPPPELDDVEKRDREKDGSVIQYVESWLENIKLTSETNEGQPSSSSKTNEGQLSSSE